MESQQETKDYLSSLFTESGAREGQEHPFPMFSEQNLLGQSLNNGQLPLDMNFLGNVMAMQGAEAQTALQTQNQSSLEQQIKLTQLQQLQQLQNHIFQQQVCPRRISILPMECRHVFFLFSARAHKWPAESDIS